MEFRICGEAARDRGAGGTIPPLKVEPLLESAPPLLHPPVVSAPRWP